MAISSFPHHGAVLVNGIEFDRHCGIGATTRAGSDGAAWAMMRPSTFLALATPLPQPRESLQWITGEILGGTPVCPAELRLRLPPNGMAAVSAHEGRHRMTRAEGDPRGCTRSRAPVRGGHRLGRGG